MESYNFADNQRAANNQRSASRLSSFEINSRELLGKLDQLGALATRLQAEELAIRAQLEASCQELKAEVGAEESKQRKIQEYLRSISVNFAP